jgi:radical SAM superfamily enzyme YgiQ (UPF0313 family)
MYTSKKFRVKKEADIFKEIEVFGEYSSNIRKVFLADGNAFVLSFDRLSRILDKLNESFSKLTRISAYALPKDILSKTDEELQILAKKGLKLLYVGIETGDNELLQRINKGETFESTSEALIKARKAGLKLSVMILNGLGGNKYTEQHAINSANVINAIQPEYLSTLVLSFPYGVDHFKNRFDGDFEELDKAELILEMGNFISHLQLENTIFRSDHASNYLILKGILNRDKEELLGRISQVLRDPVHANLRPDWMRGL